MSNTASVLIALTQALSLVNVLVRMSDNERELRELVAKAAAEGRTLNKDELDQLRGRAQDAIDRLGEQLP